MEKYEKLGRIGEGSYGLVIKCRHKVRVMSRVEVREKGGGWGGGGGRERHTHTERERGREGGRRQVVYPPDRHCGVG